MDFEIIKPIFAKDIWQESVKWIAMLKTNVSTEQLKWNLLSTFILKIKKKVENEKDNQK